MAVARHSGPREGFLALRLTAITYAAETISLFEFRRPDGGDLPPFTAGAHIDIDLPNGLSRQYSLANPEGERHRYVVGVKRDRASRGGSAYMHDQLRVGTIVEIGVPRNHFALVEDAPHVTLLAGGIGITPLWCMAQRLAARGRAWTLHYACRTRAECAFAAELAALGDHARFHFDDEEGGRFLDPGAVVAGAPAGSHLYCCGPTPMIEAFEAAAAGLPAERVHVEHFTAAPLPPPPGGFVVELAKSGRSFPVLAGKTILDTLVEAGLNLPFSCEQGVCGTCETKVVSGVPDHRDLVLSESERAAGRTMMICCSGAKSDRIVLDL